MVEPVITDARVVAMYCGSDRFLADLHIHSRFSRATSRDLTIPAILRACQMKGIDLVATGDFTHPEWFGEIRNSLVEDGGGLLEAAPSIAGQVSGLVPEQARRPVKFIISGEISSIYKKNGRTRKVHSLVFMPSLESASRFSIALGRLGNITSDGRPILGLDPMRILQLAMDINPGAFLIPAHIWTPHFSVFGAMSGFDTIEECFEDLTPYIFAVETGLSSDVGMNRLWSALDRFSLTSSSDAHSVSKLGREATIFSGQRSWDGLVSALKGLPGPTRLEGTVEFFPEEGKYHLDGHRKCGFSCEPSESMRLGGICPVCGGRLTPGVLGRVAQLADRTEVPAGFPGQIGLVPLGEVLSGILGCGEGSGRVQSAIDSLVARFGSELDILGWIDPGQLDADREYALAEAVRRIREGRVVREPGFDGEYGRIGIFGPGEVEMIKGQGQMFGTRAPTRCRREGVARAGIAAVPEDLFDCPRADDVVPSSSGLTPEQAAAANCLGCNAIVVAGPGTGKTRTMVARVAALVESGVAPASILVVTFTNRAAGEAAERITAVVGIGPVVTTFHALALSMLKRAARERGQELPQVVVDVSPDAELPVGHLTLDGLVPVFIREMRLDPSLASCFAHILVDEFQDISDDQYEMLRLMAAGGATVFCVGDPDQSIYGFRGAVPQVFDRFQADWPGCFKHVICLTHRLTPEVASAATAVLGRSASGSAAAIRSVHQGGRPVILCSARHTRDEAGWIAGRITTMLGGTDMLDSAASGVLTGLGDIAILGRTHNALLPVAKALDAAGLPYETASDAPLWHMDWVRVAMRAIREADPMNRLDSVVSRALAGSGIEPPARQVRILLDLAGATECGPAFDRLVTLCQVDAFGLDPERIHLLTMHASKGLEFDNVFVVGLNHGMVPLATGGDFDEDEERRLLFVAMTRARRNLFLSWSSAGRQGLPVRSRFLDGLGDLVVQVRAESVVRHRALQQDLFGGGRDA